MTAARPPAARPYGPDLAEAHDRDFGDVARRGAATAIAALRRNRHRAGLVVDLGSGSGILARSMVDAGYDVLGVELSADMISLARAKVPEATFVQGSLFDADLPPCVAVTATGECVAYTFDDRAGADRFEQLARRIHASLVTGGVFVFDVPTPGRNLGLPVRYIVNDGPDWTITVRAVEDAEAGLLDRAITVFRRDGDVYRRSDERHVQRLYRPGDVAAMLERCGFSVRRLRGYDGVRFQKGWAGFVATKPPG